MISSRDQAKRLLEAFKTVKIIAFHRVPFPYKEVLIRKGLEKEYDVDFIATTTRDASVHTGNPFIVEAGIAYGGSLPKEENRTSCDSRIGFLYCINKVGARYYAVEKINWRNYELLQPGGSGIPKAQSSFSHTSRQRMFLSLPSQKRLSRISPR